MKLKVVFVLVLFTLSVSIRLLAQTTQIPASVNAWWTGDDTTIELVSGVGGNLHNGASFTQGLVGRGFSFNGSSQYVSVPDSPRWTLGSADFTIELWARFNTGISNSNAIFIGHDQGSGEKIKWFFGRYNGHLLFHINGSMGPQFFPRADFIPTPRQWYHLGITRLGNVFTIFVNGTAVKSETRSYTIQDPAALLTIGHAENIGFVNGQLDEITIHNRALSSEEMRSIFQAGSTGKGKTFGIVEIPAITVQTNMPLLVQLEGFGGSPPYQWSLSESRLPEGVVLTTNGILQGTPSETGEFRFGVRATDLNNDTALGYVTIRVPIPVVPYDAPPDIIAWWPFEDDQGSPTLEDRIGTNIAAKANSPTSIPGKVGQALQFNGEDQYLSVQNSPEFRFGTNNFTIEMWVRFDASGGGSIGEPSHIMMGSSDGPGFVHKWFFALGGGSLNFHVNGPSVGSAFYPLGAFTPTISEWYHIAVVRERNTLTSYINGEQKGFATNIINIPITTAPVTIGQSEFIGMFIGAIDEPTVYRKALTAEEIQAVCNAEGAGKIVEVRISPAIGGTDGTITVHIEGIAFEQGAEVQLTKAGETNIVGDPTTVSSDGRYIEAVFDLHGAPLGSWNVEVTSSATTVILPGGFTVQERRAPNLWAEIIGLGLIRPGRTQQFNVFYGNEGNVDSSGGIIWISGIPSNAIVNVHSVLPAVPPPDPQLMTNEIPSAVFDLNGERVVMVMLKRVRPESPRSFSFSLAIPTAQSMNLNTWVYTKPDYEANQNITVPGCTYVSCAAAIDQGALREAMRVALRNWPRDNLLTQVLNGQGLCIGAAANLLADLAQAGLSPESELSGWGIYTINGGSKQHPGEHNSTMLASPHTGERWLIDNSAFPQICKMASVGENKWITSECDWLKAGNEWSIAPIGPSIPCRLPAKQKTHTVDTVNSFDPNDQLGPEGVGEGRYLSGKDPLNYVIRYENMATATAPAQEIVVTNILDPYKVDIASVQLGDIRIGTNVISVPPGLSSYSTVFDLRTNENMVVAIDCNLDPNKAQLTWRFRGLDPATMQFPEDPLAGFLPPNTVPPNGEGSVSFSVSARDSIATGTCITNIATIIFDYNPPIETPSWVNTFDLSSPTIEVMPLHPAQVNDKFELQWSSTDTGSGVERVTVEISTNQTQFVPMSQTSSISMVITGQVSSTYSFRVTAIDSVGYSNQTVVATDSTLLFTRIHPLATNYMAWARSRFGSAVDDLSKESTLWGITAVPSNSASPNFFNWYYRESPYTNSQVSIRQFPSGPVFEIIRRKNEPNAILDVLWKPEITQPWNVLFTPPQAITNTINATYEQVSWSCNLQSTNQGFYRPRLSLSP